MPDAYPGLPHETPAFLAALAANNRKDWFEGQRASYERDWRDAGLSLVEALGPFCAAASPRLDAIPRVGGSLRRIHRDTRFSSDKSPYAPMLHIVLAVAGGAAHSGMHLVVHPETFGFGAGEWMLAPDRLARFRGRVQDEGARAALLAAARTAEGCGSRWDAPDLVRLPKGTAADPAWEHLLRRKSVILRGEGPHPAWLFTPEALPRLQALVAAHLPLLAWLRAL